MLTMETTLPVGSAGFTTEQGETSNGLFGQRDLTNLWHPQEAWVRYLLAPPARDTEDSPVEQVISSDELTLEKASLTSGRVAVALSDDQAEQVMRLGRGD